MKQVSLFVPQGATAAVVGASGSGKTTLASLIPRFFDADEGSITIGGIDVREIGTEELMKLVSFVFQDSRLFKDSLLNNIRQPGRMLRRRRSECHRAAQCGDITKNAPGA